MATLEKIRNKSALLFIIIIVALLAFILGDFLTSGRTYFGHPGTVAQAGDATVEHQDYQTRLTQAGEQLRQQGREISNDVLSQQVVQALLTEKLLKNEYNKLGITVTDAELTEALTGENPHPQAAQMIQYLAMQLGLPEATGAAVFDAMQNPAKYNLPTQVGDELRQIWSSQEKELEQAMLNQKFMSLLVGLYTYNKLDAKSFYDDNATTREVAYVVKDASSVSDDDIEFTDADIKALWESEKQNYKLDEPMTEINYIYVPVEPSRDDLMAAQQAVENAIHGLRTTPGTDAVASDSRFVVSTAKTTLSGITNARLRDSIAAHEPGYAFLLNRNGNDYTIAKYLDTTTGIDSINVSVLRAAEGVDLDALATRINGGASFASLNNDSIQSQDSIWTSLEVVGIDETTRNALANATVGSAFVLTDTIQGQPVSALYRVNRRHAPVKYYEVATIDYTVDPSQQTLTDLTTALRSYVSNNSSADEFAKNATEAGSSVLSDQVGPSSTGIGNARDSRKFVKWAVENDKGKVSPMLQDDRQSYLVAIAVVDKYDKYLPWTSPSINPQLAARARNNKKAEKLMADYAGKANDLQGYATAMGAEVQHGNVNITTPVLLNVGMGESLLQGTIAATEKGKFVGPLKGNRGIMVFEVENINTESRPFDEADYGQRFAQTFGLARSQSPVNLLLGKEKVDNRSLNFIQAVGE